jgi:hypothetical protein
MKNDRENHLIAFSKKDRYFLNNPLIDFFLFAYIIDSKMKRETRKPLEHDSDEKVESRIGLKNKLCTLVTS